MPKKLASMQPYFFPYLGYFSLIKNTDKFCIFDPVQFIRHGWIERNRVLKPEPENDWQYIRVPLASHSSYANIKDIKIDNSKDWKGKLLKQLAHYKRKSPFYNETIRVVEKGLSIDTESIVLLNTNCIKNVCEYLEIPFNYSIFSEMGLNIDNKILSPDDWALYTCKAIEGINEYWNPVGGKELYDKEKYAKAGIKLCIQKMNLRPYPQRRGPENIITGLSIIDVMMFNHPEKIREMLDDYELI